MILGKDFRMPPTSCMLLRRSPAYVSERMGSIKCSELTGLNLLEPPVLPLHRLLIPNLLHQQKVLQGIPVDRLTPCGGCYLRIPTRRPKVHSPGQGGSGRRNTSG